MKVFNCDFHVHTCLSPCADLDMHPRLIIQHALNANINIIAICDHNSSENVPYVINAARDKEITILPGMEITTKEETHVLAVFDNLGDLAQVQAFVYKNLPGKNNEKKFGIQAVVNEYAEVVYINDKLLIGAADISLNEVVALIHKFNGIAVAAHIDREIFSVYSQLGFIDKKMNFDAIEISGSMGIGKGREKYRNLAEYPFITSSDAHFLTDIGFAVTRVLMAEPCLSELKMALRNENGRKILEQ